MKFLTCYYSNRLEALSLQLSALMRHDPLPPFEKELIPVESAAMAGWVSEQVARHNGIAANLAFPFPSALLWQIYRAQQPDLPVQSAFDREPLAWRLFALFRSNQLSDNLFSPLRQYLERLKTDRQQLDFAAYVAGLYDQYQIYRPEMLLGWHNEPGTEAHWQAALWRLLKNSVEGEKDRAEIYAESLGLPLPDVTSLGIRRLHFFALGSLPKAMMDIFMRLGEVVEVNFFVLNPCAVFWQDSYRRSRDADMMDVDESANDLLLQMAQQGREFIGLLQTYPFRDEVEAYLDKPPVTLLSHLQHDILHLQQKGASSERQLLKAGDNSLVFHACHSPLREVQVAKNQILHFLNTHPSVEMDEVAVFVTDPEIYSPYFKSVFESDEPVLPFHLAERKSLQKTSSKRALLSLLSLPLEHFKRSSVINLLKMPVVGDKFGITDISLIAGLLEELQMHFGLGDDSWLQYGESVVSMALEQAIERLLVAYCLEDSDEIDQVAGIDEQVADQVGRFCLFVERLSCLSGSLNEETPANWVLKTRQWMEVFLEDETDVAREECREIHRLMDDKLAQLQLGGDQGVLSYEVYSHTLTRWLEEIPAQHYFRKGVINIGTLLPMRSLPFKKICLLGMNDGEFPRVVSQDPEDFLRKSPKPCDRNRQQEDRYLFLEAILAASSQLHISYIGKSQIDNTVRFPSLPVAELRAFINRNFRMEGVDDLASYLTIHHPLQPFDGDYYFTSDVTAVESVQSFSQVLLEQAKVLREQKHEVPVFAQRLEDPVRDDICSIDKLVEAVVSPQRFYLRQQNIRSFRGVDDDPDNEIMQSDGINRYLLRVQLLERCRLGKPSGSAADYCRKGLVPQGAAGEMVFLEEQKRVACLWSVVEKLGLVSVPEGCLIRLSHEGMMVEGELSSLNTSGDKRLAFTGKRLKGKTLLQAFIEHVLIILSNKRPLTSYIVTEEVTVRFNTVPEEACKKFFSAWIERFHEAKRHPVPFFVESSWQYMQALREGKGKETAVLEAALYGDDRRFGEMDEPACRYVYRGQEGFSLDETVEHAQTGFAFLRDYMEEVSL